MAEEKFSLDVSRIDTDDSDSILWMVTSKDLYGTVVHGRTLSEALAKVESVAVSLHEYLSEQEEKTEAATEQFKSFERCLYGRV